MTPRIARPFAALTVALAAAIAAPPADATDLPLSASGAWQSFSVDDFISQAFDTGWIDDTGAPLAFTFSIAPGTVGKLTIVDGNLAGDTFAITNFGAALGTTSAVPAGTYESPIDAGYDYDAALVNPAFSRGVFTLGSGSYSISGSLLQSVTSGGIALNATTGAVQLSVSVVPEPATLVQALAGLGLLGLVLARRRR